MNPKDFESLEHSLREVGEIMHGIRKPAREFVYEVDRSATQPIKTWAVYVEDDDEGLLIPGKLYEVEISRNSVWVRDEEGEATVCPIEFFMPVSLPAEVTERLSEIKKLRKMKKPLLLN